MQPYLHRRILTAALLIVGCAAASGAPTSAPTKSVTPTPTPPATAQAAPPVLTFTKGGVTATILERAWIKDNSGRKGLLVRYKLSAGPTAPFRVSTLNTRASFVIPNGNNFGSEIYGSDGVFSRSVSPRWKTAQIVFSASDLNAEPSDRLGSFMESLTWPNVPVPSKLDSPITVGTSSTTAHGTVVTLTQIETRSPVKAGDPPYTVVTVQIQLPSAIADLRAEPLSSIALTSDTGDSLIDSKRFVYPVYDNSPTNGKISVHYDIPFSPIGQKLTALKLTLPILETAASLRNPTCYREITADVPLAGIAGTDGDPAIVPLGDVKVGSLECTLDSMTHRQSRWNAVLWLKVPEDGPPYTLGNVNVATDTGVSIIDKNTRWTSPSYLLWKLNGQAPTATETPVNFSFLLGDVPTDAKSLTVTATAQATVRSVHHFAFKLLPCPAPYQSVDVNAVAAEIPDASKPATASPDGPTTMTILSIESLDKHGFDGGTDAVLHWNIHFRIDNLPYRQTFRMVTPVSYIDNLGRKGDLTHAVTSSSGNGQNEFIGLNCPAADAKTVNMEFKVEDEQEDSPPVDFVFTGLPLPKPDPAPAAK